MRSRRRAACATPWKPGAYTEHFGAAIRQLVKRKIAAGQSKQIAPLEEAPAAKSSNVVDLTELLAKSLRAARGAAGAESSPRRRPRRASATRERTRRAS